MTQREFLLQSESEQNIFYAKMMHAAKHNEISFDHFYFGILVAEKNGHFNNVKFGSEVYQEETITT